MQNVIDEFKASGGGLHGNVPVAVATRPPKQTTGSSKTRQAFRKFENSFLYWLLGMDAEMDLQLHIKPSGKADGSRKVKLSL